MPWIENSGLSFLLDFNVNRHKNEFKDRKIALYERKEVTFPKKKIQGTFLDCFSAQKIYTDSLKQQIIP